ncbi:MAG: hypothetical protein J07AB43_00450 [Candidatus Nanosalina sp. J07AB43]|nr:MAG: hypothetical protein J07AB43_00450 [Candidatus Nanosalina sp. J07AB43]
MILIDRFIVSGVMIAASLMLIGFDVASMIVTLILMCTVIAQFIYITYKYL